MPDETQNAIASPIDEDNTNLLHQAIFEADYKKVEKLLRERKVNVDAENTYGDKPLYVAALYNQVQIAKILLDYGAKSKCEV
ncbi:ankyrin repeat domain-containing protein [Candidatus Phycorickettsia trachydisci]|uniref:ankyrin repeat domain-containing protein n=1 Tax=Candidatus Phycorickettsia trachydisci TaxID=2115978 RepID=UPI00131A53A9|nr:ankyrin repeat domain-containing protein [Candidatus Phycorickettsia trachydisci]